MTPPSLNPMNRRKQRIDDLARSTAGPAGAGDGSVAVLDAGTVDETPGVSLIASAWRRLRRDPVFLFGATIIALFILLAIFSPWLAPHDPSAGLLLDKVRPADQPGARARARLPARRRRPRSGPALPPARSAAARPWSSGSSPPSSG